MLEPKRGSEMSRALFLHPLTALLTYMTCFVIWCLRLLAGLLETLHRSMPYGHSPELPLIHSPY